MFPRQPDGCDAQASHTGDDTTGKNPLFSGKIVQGLFQILFGMETKGKSLHLFK